jgi:hypothetical protein
MLLACFCQGTAAFNCFHIYFLAMALVLYLVIHKEDQAACDLALAVQRRYVTPKWNYIGLRETLADAVERRYTTWGGKEVELVTNDTHVGLRVTITSHGVAELVRRISAPEDCYSSTLFKKIFPNDKKFDWKVWHYVGDLPLKGHALYDTNVYEAEWIPLTSDSDS